MHRTGVDGALSASSKSISATKASVLSGAASRRRAVRSRSAARSSFVRSVVELLCERRLGWFVGHRDRSQPIRAGGRAVLEDVLARLLEEDVDHDPLGRRQENLVDEALVLVVSAVSADELHASSRQRHVEDASVGGVGEVEAHDLAALRGEREVWLSRDEHDVAEAAHRDMRRFRGAEAGDLPVFDENVVQRQEQLAVDGRPVVRLGAGRHGCCRTAHLLAVVLADVRVVPVRAGIGDVQLVREGPPTGIGACVSCVPS